MPNEIEPDEQSKAEADELSRKMRGEELHPLSTYPAATAVLLFSESNTRFLCEVEPEKVDAFEAAMNGVSCALVGEVTDTDKLEIIGVPCPIPEEGSPAPVEIGAPIVIEADLKTLKDAWRKPLAW